MGILDIILLVLFIPAIVRGISKGFIEQLIALLSIFLSAWVAYMFADTVSEWLSRYISLSSPTVLYIISFVIVIVLCVMLLNLISRLITRIVGALSLGWLNRLLGFVLALLNTAIVIGLLFVLFKDINAKYLHLSTTFMQESVIYGVIERLTDSLFPYLEKIFTNVSEAVQNI